MADPLDRSDALVKARAISIPDAEAVSASRGNVINNRSFTLGIENAGKKILISGDIAEEGWEKAFEYKSIRGILTGTNLFVAFHHGRLSGRHLRILDFTGTPDVSLATIMTPDNLNEHQIERSETLVENM